MLLLIFTFTQSLLTSWRIPATPASTTQNIGCPSIMTPSKMGKTKNLIFYSLSDDQSRATYIVMNSD